MICAFFPTPKVVVPELRLHTAEKVEENPDEELLTGPVCSLSARSSDVGSSDAMRSKET